MSNSPKKVWAAGGFRKGLWCGWQPVEFQLLSAWKLSEASCKAQQQQSSLEI